MKRRLAVSSLIGMASGLLCWLIHVGRQASSNDFNWALHSAQALLLHEDPYAVHLPPHGMPYPLPATFFALPLLWAGSRLAGALFWGASSALLAFGLTREGYTRLLIFLAFPYWAAMLCVQWSPLVMAGAFLPWMVPAALAKPQIGIPIMLAQPNWRGFVACAAVAAASLLVLPSWPMKWLGQLGGFESYVPLLVLPLGLTLLLALWNRDDPDSHLFLLSALMPQHWFYDAFILWLIPKTRREILATCLLSWGAALWRGFHTPHSWAEFGLAAVGWIYLPMLAVILVRRSPNRSSDPAVAVDRTLNHSDLAHISTAFTLEL